MAQMQQVWACDDGHENIMIIDVEHNAQAIIAAMWPSGSDFDDPCQSPGCANIGGEDGVFYHGGDEYITGVIDTACMLD